MSEMVDSVAAAIYRAPPDAESQARAAIEAIHKQLPEGISKQILTNALQTEPEKRG